MPRRRFSAAVREGDDVVATILVALATVGVAVLGTRATLLAGEARDDWQRAAKLTVDQQQFFVFDTLLGFGAGRAALAAADRAIAARALGFPNVDEGVADPPELRIATPYVKKRGYFPVVGYVRKLDREHRGSVALLDFGDGDSSASHALADAAGALLAAVALALAALASHARRHLVLAGAAVALLALAAAVGIAVEVVA